MSELKKSFDLLVARLFLQWGMWFAGFVVGFILGAATGSTVFWLGSGAGWSTGEHVNMILWGAALIGAGMGAFLMDRLRRSPTSRATGFPETLLPRNAAIVVVLAGSGIVVVQVLKRVLFL